MTDLTPTPAAPAPLSAENQRTWATLVHVGWIAGSFVGLAFLPSLIAFLVLKDRGAYVRLHTAAALNFQLSWLIWGIALGVFSVITLGFGALLFLPYGVAYLILTIIDAVHASKDEAPGQNLSISFIK